MQKFIYNSIIIILIGWIITLYFVLLKTDLATMQVNDTNLKIVRDDYKYMPPVVLVSYGDGDPIFLSNQIALAESALNKGIDIIYNYGRHNIDSIFYEKNKAILRQSRGAGYWLWKPYFILKTMQELPDDSIIIYADGAVVFSEPPINKFKSLLKDHDFILVGHGKPAPIKRHLKKEAQIILGIDQDDKILDSQEVWAYFMIIKNNKSSRKFVQEWLAICQNKDLLTDEPFDTNIQDKDMEWHLHDQSLMSVLVAQQPEKKIIIPRYKIRKHYGLDNFHRHPHAKYTSPKFHAAGLNKKIANLLYNNFFINNIRQLMMK